MRVAASNFIDFEKIQGELNGNRSVIVHDADGKDVAAVVSIEDLYLLQKFYACQQLTRSGSRLPEAIKV